VVVEPLRGLRAAAAGLLMQAPDGGELRVAPAVSALSTAEGMATVSFLLELAGDSLAASAPPAANTAPSGAADASEPEPLRLELYAYLLGAGGAVLGHAGSTMQIDVDQASPLLSDGGLRIAGTLQATDAAPPDRLRLLLLDPVTNRHGLGTVALGSAGGTGGALLLPAPSFPSTGVWWLVHLGHDQQIADQAARPVLIPGLQYSVTLAVDSLRMPTSSLRGLRTTLRPLRATERTSERTTERTPERGNPRGAPRDITLPTSPSRSPNEGHTLQLEVPRDVRPGPYRLTISFNQERTAWTTLPIEVWVAPRDLEPEAATLSWPDLLRLGSDPAAGPNATAASGRKLDARTASYLRALTLANTDSAASLEGLLEPFSVAGNDLDKQRDVLTSMARAVVRMVRDSGSSQSTAWQLLVPLIEHHHRAFLRGYTDGRGTAGQNQLDVVDTLARLFPAGNIESEGRGLIADALVVAARDCESFGLLQRSERLLTVALEVDESHGTAGQMLAFSRERRGDVPGAIAAYEILHRRDPRNREVRLRLAALEQRGGRPRDAERLARELIGERTGDWIEQLAMEIRGSIALGEDDIAGAVVLLRQAVAEHSDNQRLRILYALALDRSNRQRQADVLLSQAEVLEPSGPSPRFRYAQPALPGIVDSERRLASALPLLRAKMIETASEQQP
jgi:hypothetical protein